MFATFYKDLRFPRKYIFTIKYGWNTKQNYKLADQIFQSQTS